MAKKNPVLYEIDGIPIRAKNKVFMMWNENEYVKLVKTCSGLNTSVSSLIRIMCSPCQTCGNDKIFIPLTLMPKKVALSGRNLSNFHKKEQENG